MAKANQQQAANTSSQQRIFKKDLQWYFRTRNDTARGPFIDKQQAYWALAKHIRQQSSYR